jgi:glycosyltransferase involved in cell wall biosynthesis
MAARDQLSSLNLPITIMIPTTAKRRRRDFLQRSIDSALTQSGVCVSVLVIANGNQCDENLLSELGRTPGVTVIREPVASLPRALEIGRNNIDTPMFGEIDDDDQFLPSALRALLDGFGQNTDADVVVGKAVLRHNHAADTMSIADIEQVRDDPLEALLRSNWLVPGSGLFRSDRVPPTVFVGIPKFLEWTFLAAVLCLNHKIAFVPDAVVVHHVGLPFSMDTSAEMPFERIEGIKKILSLPLPEETRCGFRRKLASAYHHCSDLCLNKREFAAALGLHINSLIHPGGWRYLPYTRQLLALIHHLSRTR